MAQRGLLSAGSLLCLLCVFLSQLRYTTGASCAPKTFPVTVQVTASCPVEPTILTNAYNRCIQNITTPTKMTIVCTARPPANLAGQVAYVLERYQRFYNGFNYAGGIPEYKPKNSNLRCFSFAAAACNVMGWMCDMRGSTRAFAPFFTMPNNGGLPSCGLSASQISNLNTYFGSSSYIPSTLSTASYCLCRTNVCNSKTSETNAGFC